MLSYYINVNVCSIFNTGVRHLKGITKVIDEMGLMILSKEIELEMKQNEIDELKKKIELIEGYLDMYDEFYNKGD